MGRKYILTMKTLPISISVLIRKPFWTGQRPDFTGQIIMSSKEEYYLFRHLGFLHCATFFYLSSVSNYKISTSLYYYFFSVALSWFKLTSKSELQLTMNILSLDPPISIKDQWMAPGIQRLPWEHTNHITCRPNSQPGVRFMASEWLYGMSI